MTDKKAPTITFSMPSTDVRQFYTGALIDDNVDRTLERLQKTSTSETDLKDMIQRLALSAHQLNNLYRLSMSLDPAKGAASVVQTLAETSLHVFRSDRAMVVLCDPNTEPQIAAQAYLNDEDDFGDGQQAYVRAVIDTVISTGQAVVTANAPHDKRFSASESLVLLRIHSLMAAPLLLGDQCFGVLQVDDRRPGLRFDEPDLRFLVAIASMGAQAYQHARLLDSQKQTIAKLQHAQSRLVRSEQLAIVGRTATALAHEIKNQLGPMALLDLLKERFPDDEEVHECAEMIRDAQQRILRMVEEMRGYAHKDQEEESIPLVPTNLVELIESVIRFLRFDGECRDVPIHLRCDDVYIVDIESDRFKQVLVNLIRNSVQAFQSTPDASPQIAITVSSDNDDRVCIEVQDNGAGIPAAVQQRIFEPFFTTKGLSGTGLGLDICRQIIQRHNGTISCSSKMGTGTTMRIMLPLET
ncbi:MAG: hypothetical protein CMH54_13355 [Myxococcales bacterium]|nr:hypothetical protein [Myxococcales bacterium]|tara:strand:- start:263 stop:1669 length:1407 start_codon:yes stop_codon:yes gene_type:complete